MHPTDLARRVNSPRRMPILESVCLLFVFAWGGCTKSEPISKIPETTVTAVFVDGHREEVPLASIDELAETREDFQGVLATDRASRQTVVISLDVARGQHPATGQYVILQKLRDEKSSGQP